MRPPRSAQGGYVLMLTLVSLALFVFVTNNFALRIDTLRAASADLQAHARARVGLADTRATLLYVLATQPFGAQGYGDGVNRLVADGRPYRMPQGAIVMLQDQRGLLSVNAIDRGLLGRLLVAQGLPDGQTDRWLDVLEDFIDTDSLKRLNGAEAADYTSLGLPPPRNDYLRSPGELAGLPGWRDNLALLQRLLPLLSTRRSSWLNPNTAPRPVLQALFPAATGEQLDRYLRIRGVLDLRTAAAFSAATGLPGDDERLLFHAGSEVRVTVWLPGLPQAVQYNVVLLPGGATGPWLITEQHSVPRPSLPSDPNDIEPFPMALAPAQRPEDLAKDPP